MSKEFDRQEHLKQLHEQKKQETTEKINKAIDSLLKANEKVNFNRVAEIADVSKATLYNKPKIKERIQYLRQKQKQVPTPKEVKIKMNKDNKDAIIASLKRKIKKLEQENQELKKKLKVNYGNIYEQI